MEWKEELYASYVSGGRAADSGKPASAHFAHRAPHIRRLIDRRFPADRSIPVLDIGCGHGALLYFLRQKGYSNVRGVDGSPEQVALAHRLGVEEVALGDGMGFLRQQESASAGVVCLFDVLEHLTRPEAFELITEIRRVLRPQGLLIGRAPNAQGIFGMSVRYGDLTHEQAFTSNSLPQMLHSLGFTAVRCFEDRPAVHGLASLMRLAVWVVGTIPFRLLVAAENGHLGGAVLTQNLLFTARPA